MNTPMEFAENLVLEWAKKWGKEIPNLHGHYSTDNACWIDLVGQIASELSARECALLAHGVDFHETKWSKIVRP